MADGGYQITDEYYQLFAISYLPSAINHLLSAISPVGSGANFGGLPPGGAPSLCPGITTRDNGPASLTVSLRLLLSVIAFASLGAIILQGGEFVKGSGLKLA
jgi:hypothetical protein